MLTINNNSTNNNNDTINTNNRWLAEQPCDLGDASSQVQVVASPLKGAGLATYAYTHFSMTVTISGINISINVDMNLTVDSSSYTIYH